LIRHDQLSRARKNSYLWERLSARVELYDVHLIAYARAAFSAGL